MPKLSADFFVVTFILLSELSFSAPASARTHHIISDESQDRNLCEQEATAHLSKVELHGETRFTEFRFDSQNATSTQVDFAEIGSDSRRRRRKAKVQPTPATPKMGQLFVMRGWGHEKSTWRNLLVRCAVHEGKVATVTYEFLESAVEPTLAALPKPTEPAPVIPPVMEAKAADFKPAENKPVETPHLDSKPTDPAPGATAAPAPAEPGDHTPPLSRVQAPVVPARSTADVSVVPSDSLPPALHPASAPGSETGPSTAPVTETPVVVPTSPAN